MQPSQQYLSFLKQFLDVSLISETAPQFELNLLEGRFKQLFEGIDSSDEKQLLFNLLLKKFVELSDKVSEDQKAVSEELNSLLESISTSEEQEQTIFSVFYTLLRLFLKENWTGPSFLSIDVNKKLKREKMSQRQIIKEKKYPEYDFSSISLKYTNIVIPADINTYNFKYVKTNFYLNCRNSQALIDSLDVDGENFPRRMPLSHLFFILLQIIQFLRAKYPLNPIYALFSSRLHFIHSQMLYLPTGTLFPKVTENFTNFFSLCKSANLRLPRAVLSNLYVENSHSLLFFFKYSASQKALSIAQELLKIEFNLTGKMGKRTKYQTFNTCHLTVQAFEKVQNDSQKQDSNSQNNDQNGDDGDYNDEINQKKKFELTEDDKKIIDEEGKDSIDAIKLINDIQFQIAPQNVQLDEECILLEKPLIDETDDFNKVEVAQKTEKSQLTLPEQILVLGIMKHHEIANPHDDIYHEYIQAYCNFLIDKSLNWMVFSTSLLYRSLNEYIRYKKMERALLQMQTLVDQYSDPLPDPHDRAKYLFSLNYPHYFDLQKTLAEKYMKMGIVMSGCQIFERLGMFEECVECLQAAGHSDRAKKLAEQHLPNATPRLLCTYGELTREIKYFKQAWKLSNKRYGKAQRLLGRAYFYANLLEKSIKAFRKAVNINKYNISPWFTMGCAYIKLNDLKNAVNCFSTVVSINEQDGESWANLSSCFMKMGKKSEALSTLEQASKFCERNWRIWENLLYVSLSNKKFYKYFECIEKLISLNQKSILDKETISKLVQIFHFQLTRYPTTEYKHQFQTYRNRIERMFNTLQIEMGEKYYVWKSWAEFKELDIDFEEMQTNYLIEKRELWISEEAKGQESKGSWISYFGEDPKATIEELKQQFVQKKKELLERIADLRMKTCQVLQIVGWHQEKQQCELVYEHTVLLVEAYKKGKDQDAMKELNMFVKSIKTIIEQNLEKPANFDI